MTNGTISEYKVVTVKIWTVTTKMQTPRQKIRLSQKIWAFLKESFFILVKNKIK